MIKGIKKDMIPKLWNIHYFFLLRRVSPPALRSACTRRDHWGNSNKVRGGETKKNTNEGVRLLRS
jgi:hypothetical protein